MKTTGYRVSIIITVPNTALLYDLARSAAMIGRIRPFAVLNSIQGSIAAHLRHGRWTFTELLFLKHPQC